MLLDMSGVKLIVTLPDITLSTSIRSIDSFEERLRLIISPLHFIMELISALCVFIGLVFSICVVIGLFFSFLSIQSAKHDFQKISNPVFKRVAWFNLNSCLIVLTSKIRLKIGLWLAVALDFQLAADILETIYVIEASQALIKLVVTAIIRVLFGYFLHWEIEKWEQQ